MTDDLLERAAASTRQRYDGRAAEGARTEALILQRLRPRSTRRRWLPIMLVPLAATLLVSAAWGTTNGELSAALHAVARAFAVSPETAPTGPRASSPLPAAQAHTNQTAPVQPPDAPQASVPQASASKAPSAAPVIPTPVRNPTLARLAPPAAVSGSIAPEATASPEALFRVANRAQFSGHDPAAAVALWDQYLSAASNGSLAPEARYNRAIALTQLGRKADARAALAPFARGDYGTYRQSEALQLLQTLGE